MNKIITLIFVCVSLHASPLQNTQNQITQSVRSSELGRIIPSSTYNQMNDSMSEINNLANQAWSLVDEDCQPEMDIRGTFNQMSKDYQQVLQMLGEQLMGNVIGNAVSMFDIDMDIDIMADLLAMTKCIQNLTSLANLGPISGRISGEIRQCIADRTKDTVKCEQKTGAGTAVYSQTGCEFDRSGFAGMAGCTYDVGSGILGELFENCYVSAKSDSKRYLENLLAEMISNAQKNFELQHEKCALDKQNFETKYSEIQGDGWSTISTGTSDEDGGLISVRRNEVLNNYENDQKRRYYAEKYCLNQTAEFRKTAFAGDANPKQRYSYIIALSNWCKSIFINSVTSSSCEKVNAINADGTINLDVPNCRWSRPISSFNPLSVVNQTGVNIPKALSRVYITDECYNLIVDKNPILGSHLFVPIINFEANLSTEDNEAIVPDSRYPEYQGKLQKNRLNYFLRKNQTINSSNIVINANGDTFSTREKFIPYNNHLTNLSNIIMLETCKVWASKTKGYYSIAKINAMREYTASNFNNSRGRLSEATKTKLEVMEKDSRIANELQTSELERIERGIDRKIERIETQMREDNVSGVIKSN